MSLFLTLPCFALESILVFLNYEELLTLRRVCKLARELATNEIRRRRRQFDRPFYVRCCNSMVQVKAMITVYGEQPNYVHYRQLRHSTCYYTSLLHLFPEKGFKDFFGETRTLIVFGNSYRMDLPNPRLLSLSDTFPNITRLEFFKININTHYFCIALRNNWIRLKSITVDNCVALQVPHWFLALNKNITSITAKRFDTDSRNQYDFDTFPMFDEKCNVYRRHGGYREENTVVSAATVNELLPRIEFLSLDTRCMGNYNAFEMINTARNLREAHLSIGGLYHILQTPILNAPLLEKLRLHIGLEAVARFYFREVRCESLRKVEFKLYSSPLPVAVNRIFPAFKNVRSVTLTATHIDGDDFRHVFLELSAFRKLEDFAFRSRLLCPGPQLRRDCETQSLLNFLRYDCSANSVCVYLQRNKLQLVDAIAVLDFVYEIVSVASYTTELNSRVVSYSISCTQNIGCLVLPENVLFVVSDDEESMKVPYIWNKKK